MRKLNFLLLIYLLPIILFSCNYVAKRKFRDAEENFLNNLQTALIKIDPNAKIGDRNYKSDDQKLFSVVGYRFYVKRLLEKSEAKELLLKYTDCFLNVVNKESKLMTFIDKDQLTFKDLHLIFEFKHPDKNEKPKRPYVQYIVLMHSTIYYYYYNEMLNDVAFKDIEMEPFPSKHVGQIAF